jgi:NTP pyrophosphatase (non-canonical NTP hydrolase)
VDLAAYFEASARFCKHYESSRLDAYAHGLMAEVGEVARVIGDRDYGALLLELGDVAWNIVQLARLVGYDVSGFLKHGWGPPAGDLEGLADLVAFASKVSGVMEKRHRNAGGDDQWAMSNIHALLHPAYQSWAVVVRRYGYTPAQVFAANIEKLTVRYGKEAA